MRWGLPKSTTLPAATFRPERAKASTWILTLVHRRAVDLVRREQRRQAEPLTDDAAGVAVSAEQTDEAAGSARARAVQTALKRLPDLQGETLELAYHGGSQSELRGGSEYVGYHQEADVRGLPGCASSTNPHRKGHGK